MHSPLLGRGPAECICNLQLQPSHSDPTSLGQGDCRVHLQSGIAAEPPTNAADRPVIAAEILQLQPKFCNCSREVLGCNSRLQMHSAGPPPKRRLEVGMARLQFQIANALCSLAAQGFYPDRPSAAESRAQRKGGSGGSPPGSPWAEGLHSAFWNCSRANPTSSPGG